MTAISGRDVVLAAVVGPSSYEVCRRLQGSAAAPRSDNEGAVIVALHRLEAQGRLGARWIESPSGRWRRHYEPFRTAHLR